MFCKVPSINKEFKEPERNVAYLVSTSHKNPRKASMAFILMSEFAGFSKVVIFFIFLPMGGQCLLHFW